MTAKTCKGFAGYKEVFFDKVDDSWKDDLLGSSLVETGNAAWCIATRDEVAVRFVVVDGAVGERSYRRATTSRFIAVRGSAGKVLSPFQTGN